MEKVDIWTLDSIPNNFFVQNKVVLLKEGNESIPYHYDRNGQKRNLKLVSETDAPPLFEDLVLNVTTPGQTQFNIFVLPDENQKHELIIDGLTVFNGDYYNLGESGLNKVLTWTGSATLTPGDKLVFRKYLK